MRRHRGWQPDHGIDADCAGRAVDIPLPDVGGSAIGAVTARAADAAAAGLGSPASVLAGTSIITIIAVVIVVIVVTAVAVAVAPALRG